MEPPHPSRMKRLAPHASAPQSCLECSRQPDKLPELVEAAANGSMSALTSAFLGAGRVQPAAAFGRVQGAGNGGARQAVCMAKKKASCWAPLCGPLAVQQCSIWLCAPWDSLHGGRLAVAARPVPTPHAAAPWPCAVGPLPVARLLLPVSVLKQHPDSLLQGVRMIVTLECTEAKAEGATPSRYTTQKVRAGAGGDVVGTCLPSCGALA